MSLKLAYIVSMTSGLEAFVKREVEALADRGHAITLFATKVSPSEGFMPRHDIPWHGPSLHAAVVGYAAALLANPLRTLRLMVEAVRFRAMAELALAFAWVGEVRKTNCQALHASFGDRKYFVAYFLHRLTRLPLSTAIHAHEIYAQPNEPLFRHALRFTKALVTISDKNHHLLKGKYGIPDDKISRIPLTVDTEFWQPQLALNVLTVARFTPRKGWAELMAAARQLGEGFRFIAVGFGDLDVAAMAREAGVAERVTVFPKLVPAQVRVLMAACDVFCLPSRPTDEEGSEGIPVVLMEAMAMGMPVIATDDGSVSELVERTLVPAGDVDALVEALQQAARLQMHEEAPGDPANRERVITRHGPANLDALERYFARVVADA